MPASSQNRTITVHRMYHGIDQGVFNPRVRQATGLAPLILSVGRLRAKKGLDILIDACRIAARPRLAVSL